MAGMPYPPTSVRIRVICGRLFSARGSVSSVLICGRLFSARSFCAFRAFCGNIFSPTEFTEFTEFVSVGTAGMPYPPTSVLIRVICGSPFSARGSVSSVCSVGISFLPQNSQNSQNLAAWVWQECHTLLHLCASVSSVGGSSLQEVLCIPCIPWELLHRLFGWCSRDCCTPWRNPRK